MMSSCVLGLLLMWMPNNANSTCRKLGEKLRQPALHAIIIHCGTKSAWIAPVNKLTDLYTQFLPKKLNLISFQWLGHPNSYHTILHYRSIPCPNTFVDSVRYFITACFISLLSYTQRFYIAELYPITMSRYTQQ